MLRFKAGDFSARMPSAGTGIEGSIATAFNDLVTLEERSSPLLHEHDARQRGAPDAQPSLRRLREANEHLTLATLRSQEQADAALFALNVVLTASVKQLAQKQAELIAEMERRQILTDELACSEQVLRRLSRQVLTSQDEERRRLARELHDETAQSLGAMIAELSALEERGDPSHVKEEVRKVRERLSVALRDIRRLAQGLHPAMLASAGLTAALEHLVAEQRLIHLLDISIRFVGLSSGDRFPAPAELVLFRAAQEALANVAKHARAATVSVVLIKNGERLRLICEDDGRGFDGAASVGGDGIGLAGMRERVELLGGELSIESSREDGTTICVTVPTRGL
jgi:signal transduction histidine kinase